jgi:phenylacetate-CoA ligase
VEVEVGEAGLEQSSDLRQRVEYRLRESIGCSFSVSLKAPGTVPRSDGGKLQRVLDRRDLG